ncbi:MAG: ATP-binding protein [Pseudomonadota bacterium]
MTETTVNPFPDLPVPTATLELVPARDNLGDTVDRLVELLAFPLPRRRHGAWNNDAAPMEHPALGAREAMRLALAEALTNVVRHSHHPDDAPIVITAGTDPNRWVVIQDEGMALPTRLLTPGASPEAPRPGDALEDLPESGWGWMLIHASVDRIGYARERGRNYLLLGKEIARSRSTAA